MVRWWEKEQPLRIGSIMQHSPPVPPIPLSSWIYHLPSTGSMQMLWCLHLLFSEGTRCCMEEPGSSGTNCTAVLSFANPVQPLEFSLTFWKQNASSNLMLKHIIVEPNWFWLDWDWFILIDVVQIHFQLLTKVYVLLLGSFKALIKFIPCILCIKTKTLFVLL